MSSTNGLELAMDKAGGMRALARKIGVTYQAIQRWVAEDRVPSDWLIAIEKATSVPREKLRPDLFKGMTRA